MKRTPDEQRAAAGEDCARCGARPGITCRGERGAPVPHHAERFMAADRRAAAARAANPEPPRRVVRMTRDQVADRLALAASVAPIGSVWADDVRGALYEVVTHALPVGDVASIEDSLVVYRDAMEHRAVFTRGLTSFAQRFSRRR